MFDFNPNVGGNAASQILAAQYGLATGHGVPWAWPHEGSDTPPSPLAQQFPLVGVAVRMWTGFAVVVLSAGLSIPRELRSARGDGASEWQVCVMSCCVVVATCRRHHHHGHSGAKPFDLVWVMTGGRSRRTSSHRAFLPRVVPAGRFGVGARRRRAGSCGGGADLRPSAPTRPVRPCAPAGWAPLHVRSPSSPGASRPSLLVSSSAKAPPSLRPVGGRRSPTRRAHAGQLRRRPGPAWHGA